jgi:hypothetical protein
MCLICTHRLYTLSFWKKAPDNMPHACHMFCFNADPTAHTFKRVQAVKSGQILGRISGKHRISSSSTVHKMDAECTAIRPRHWCTDVKGLNGYSTRREALGREPTLHNGLDQAKGLTGRQMTDVQFKLSVQCTCSKHKPQSIRC